ncbi:Ornithine decarboxylase antizyme 2 [Phlyctochytrium planicorne]|nr:Ornithine decarboxylase antizyme 2 [Phlyctochytrium planicorne]
MTSNITAFHENYTSGKSVVSYQPSTQETLAACTVSQTASGAKSTYWFTSAPPPASAVGRSSRHLAPNPNVSLSFVEEVGLTVEGDVDALVCISSRLRGIEEGNGESCWPAFISRGTLFLMVPNSDGDLVSSGFGFKESVAAVLELAEDVLDCTSVVICLDKTRSDLSEILRAFLFVGFEVVHPSVYAVNSKFVLVGQSF